MSDIVPVESLFKKKHVSYSEWQLFRNFCQWRWKLDHNDGLKKLNYGIHLDFGTSIHEAIELSHVPKNKKKEINDIEAHFEQKFRSLISENVSRYNEKDKKADIESMVSAGKLILKNLDQCELLKEGTVMFNEYPLMEKIDNDAIDISFKGFIDMVLLFKKKNKVLVHIIDFKTCSWGWDLEKKQDIDVLAQLALYKHFFCKKHDLDAKNVRTTYVLLKKRPRTARGKDIEYIETFTFSTGPIMTQRCIDAFNNDVTKMFELTNSGSLKKNRDNCVSKYGDKCPYYQTEYCK